MTTGTEEKVAQEERAVQESARLLDGVLIDRQCAWWRGKTKLSPQDLGLKPEEVPDIFSLGRKLVIPASSLRRFERISARVEYLLDQFSFPFPTGSARFVPYSVLPQVMEEVHKLRADFAQETEKFIERYDEYRQQMLEEYPQHKEALERGAIAPDKLRKRFAFGYVIYEVVLPKGIRFKAIEEKEAIQGAVARQQAITEAQEEYRKQFEAQIDEFLESSVEKLRIAVGNTVLKVADKLSAGEAVTAASLDSLRKTIDKFRTLNFVGDNEVESRLKDLEALIPKSSTDLKNADVASNFARALESIQTTLLESDVSKVTGEYKRRVRL